MSKRLRALIVAVEAHKEDKDNEKLYEELERIKAEQEEKRKQRKRFK